MDCGVPQRGAPIKVGVVSDTHGYFDPRLPDVLKGTKMILHAGDVGSAEVFDELCSIAPVRAVRGNVDGAELSLPLARELNLGPFRVEMMHILPVTQSDLEAWGAAVASGTKAPRWRERFLSTFKAGTGIVIFGHSHSPCLIRLDQLLLFNPGSAGRKRFSLPRCCGLLEVSDDCLRASLVPLEEGGPPLPEKVSLAIEGINR